MVGNIGDSEKVVVSREGIVMKVGEVEVVLKFEEFYALEKAKNSVDIDCIH